MTKLEKKLRTSLRKLGITKTDRILIAASGGADSTALLDALARWKKSESLFVAHLNHQLRGEESDADEAFVLALAEQLHLPCFIAKEPVASLARQEKKNLEATARRLRYDFLLSIAQKCQANVIVTAHTQNDQVETLIMRLLRGTSAAGLQGIHTSINLLPSIRLVRPMLEVIRGEVLDHCNHYQLTFCQDSSNKSLNFTRNRIREELLPALETFNPAIGQTLIRLATQISEDEQYFQSQTDKLVNELMDGCTLNFKPLLSLPAALRRRVLRQWLRQARGNLRCVGNLHLMSLDDLITKGEGNSFVELPESWRVCRIGKTLKLQPIYKTSRI